MHYQIKLIGTDRSPRKPWLTLGMVGKYRFAGAGYAHKFSDIQEAKNILDDVNAKEKKAFMTWHDGEHWGEVNRDYLAKLDSFSKLLKENGCEALLQ
jgi:hypothetical protein